ncbi:MAG TPA: DUF4340 domain-containing protein [Nevskiaceae bacterium]|nr:DUF4340 domain-containing protein [Nevskiaceae bacterium]
MRRRILNLVLLTITVALTAVVWFTQKKEEKGPPLTALKPEAITRILVQHPGKPAIRLEKEGDRWKMLEPVQAETDLFEINGILELADLEVKQKIEGGAVDRKALELDPPQYTVTLNDQAIALGGTEPIKYRRYVATGEMLGLVDDPPSAALDDNYSDLVSKQVVPKTSAIAKLELPGLTVQRTPAGEWGVTEQPQAKAAQVAKLVESWKNASALWNSLDEPPTNAGEHVRVGLEDGRTLDFYVTAKDPQLVLASPALRVRYTLSKVLATELFQVPEEKPAEEKPAEEKPADEKPAP